jgi:hypothetical protein
LFSLIAVFALPCNANVSWTQEWKFASPKATRDNREAAEPRLHQRSDRLLKSASWEKARSEVMRTTLMPGEWWKRRTSNNQSWTTIDVIPTHSASCFSSRHHDDNKRKLSSMSSSTVTWCLPQACEIAASSSNNLQGDGVTEDCQVWRISWWVEASGIDIQSRNAISVCISRESSGDDIAHVLLLTSTGCPLSFQTLGHWSESRWLRHLMSTSGSKGRNLKLAFENHLFGWVPKLTVFRCPSWVVVLFVNRLGNYLIAGGRGTARKRKGHW